MNRAGYTALKSAMLRRGDTLVIKSLDQLSRNKADIKNELVYSQKEGIRLKILNLPTTLTDFPTEQAWIADMIFNILVEVLSTIAEQERQTIGQRQAEGIEAAKAKGVKLGRPKAVKPDNWETVIADCKGGIITAKRAMELMQTKRTNFYKMANSDL